jgi:hypothetical protein
MIRTTRFGPFPDAVGGGGVEVRPASRRGGVSADADAVADAARRGIGMHGHGLARRRWTKCSRGDSLRMGLDMRVVLASRRA